MLGDRIASVYDIFLEKYGKYTEIQKAAIPIVASGGNCLIIAPTGAGKTEAAILPLIDATTKDENKSGIRILYITPLRALNRDMIRRLEWLCKAMGVSVGVRHGDTTQAERSRQAKIAQLILITTPETLQSIMPTKHLGIALKNLKSVVIDEIHELYYNKRGAQLSLGLERLEEIAPNFQRIGVSATIGDAETVKSYLCNRKECRMAKVDTTKSMEIRIELPTKHRHELREFMERFGLDGESLGRLETISNHISHSKSVLLFANTRQIVEAVGSRLVHLNTVRPFGGIGVHHSSLDRNERIAIENSFKQGSIRSIMATSSLELGIDVGNVDLVIQYGSPRQVLRLVQRVGRSGHTHSGISRGVIVTTSSIDCIETIAICKNLESNSLERFKPQTNALDVLANQICGIALDKGTLGIEDAYGIVKRSFVYGDLSLEKLKELVLFMNRQKMVGFDGKMITSGGRTRMYYYGHLSVIPDFKRFLVKSIADNRIISTLDERFVVNNVEENSVFITKGLPWKAISIDKNVISVEPNTDLEAAVPDWTGEDIPVSHDVAQTVFGFLENPEKFRNKDLVDAETYAVVKDFVGRQARYHVPSGKELLVEELDNYKVLYTGLGTQGNEALSRLLAYTLSIKLARSINIKSSPYIIFLEIPREVNIDAFIGALDSEKLGRVMESALNETELFRYRFVTIAKLFGVIDKEADVSRSLARRIIKVMRDTPIYEETMRELTNNYFDLEALKNFLSDIKSGKVTIRHVSLESLSPLTRVILNSAYYTKELIAPLTPNSELVESFSRYMLGKQIKLLCTYCGFRFTRKLEEVKDMEKILCPNCKSPMITVYDDKFEDAVKRRIAGKKLGAEGKKALKEALAYASLFDSYGGRAAVSLSVYGIGPKTAARALMMFRHDERSFFIDLLEAQKTFIRTRKYWSI